jgi:hypothetical protein
MKNPAEGRIVSELVDAKILTTAVPDFKADCALANPLFYGRKVLPTSDTLIPILTSK